MPTELDVPRIVRSWLHEDEHDSADRVLALVLAELDTTPQRRSRWPVGRIIQVNIYAKLAIAAAAVLVVAIVGINLLPGTGSGVGGSRATPSPSPAQSPSSLPPTGSLSAGITYTGPSGEVPFTFAVPTSDWTPAGNGYFGGHNATGNRTYLSFFSSRDTIPGVFADSCLHEGDLRTFDPSPTGNAEAMTALSGVEVVRGPSDITVDGRPGRSVVVRVPDSPGCTNESYWLQYSASCAGPANVGCTSYPWWLGETIRSWFVDVDGAVFTVTAETLSRDASADLETELQQIVDSIRFE